MATACGLLAAERLAVDGISTGISTAPGSKGGNLLGLIAEFVLAIEFGLEAALAVGLACATGWVDAKSGTETELGFVAAAEFDVG
jgi:hypothetical protein